MKTAKKSIAVKTAPKATAKGKTAPKGKTATATATAETTATPTAPAAPVKGKGKGKTATAPAAPVKGKGKTAPAATPTAPTPRHTKKGDALELLKKGVSLQTLMDKFGWQRHTVRGFISVLGKTHAIESAMVEGARTYKISGGK
jgi:Protein of unknown function (DUF3489)